MTTRQERDSIRHRANRNVPYPREALSKTPPRLWVYRPEDCDHRDMQPSKPDPINDTYVALEYVRSDVALHETDKEVEGAIQRERAAMAAYLIERANELIIYERTAKAALELRAVAATLRAGIHTKVAKPSETP